MKISSYFYIVINVIAILPILCMDEIGNTDLIRAVQNNDKYLVKQLLDDGADQNIQDHEGKTVKDNTNIIAASLPKKQIIAPKTNIDNDDQVVPGN